MPGSKSHILGFATTITYAPAPLKVGDPVKLKHDGDRLSPIMVVANVFTKRGQVMADCYYWSAGLIEHDKSPVTVLEKIV